MVGNSAPIVPYVALDSPVVLVTTLLCLLAGLTTGVGSCSIFVVKSLDFKELQGLFSMTRRVANLPSKSWCLSGGFSQSWFQAAQRAIQPKFLRQKGMCPLIRRSLHPSVSTSAPQKLDRFTCTPEWIRHP